MTQHNLEKESLNVNLLPDKKLLELLEFYERKITTGKADFEEFNAFVLCQHERNRRHTEAARVGDA